MREQAWEQREETIADPVQAVMGDATFKRDGEFRAKRLGPRKTIWIVFQSVQPKLEEMGPNAKTAAAAKLLPEPYLKSSYKTRLHAVAVPTTMLTCLLTLFDGCVMPIRRFPGILAII